MSISCSGRVQFMYMTALLSERNRAFLRAVSGLAYCNPFLTERAEFERAALGREFLEGEAVWSLSVDAPEAPRQNAWRVMEKSEPVLEAARERLATEGT